MAKGKARGGAEAAAKRDEELRRTMERLEEGVRGVFESARYRRYLAVMSRFHSYSANNCLLIAMQRPDATLVAGYRAWQDKFGRQVRKGERGMRILSPVVVKAKGEGDDVGEVHDGSAGDGPRRRLAGFRLATVFDVSQTEGRELPALGVDELTGGVARYEAAMRAVSEVSRYPVSFEDVPGGAKGFFSRSEPKRIVIQKGMSQAQTLKTAIHEQNAFPGVTNKLLAPDVDIVFAAVPAAVEKLGAPDKTLVVGNPVRPEVFAQAANREAIRAQLGAGDRTVILSFGGSLGARRVNEVVADLCAWEQHEHKPVLHLHATGQYGVQLFEQLQKQKDFAPGDSLVVKEYINNMPELLAAADLVISRAGALTLAELEAVGRAAVLIPSPNVAENHQYYNAMELQKAGAAVVIEEKDLTGEKLVQTVSGMLAQPGKLAEMGRNARSLSVDDSLDRIADALLKLVKTP